MFQSRISESAVDDLKTAFGRRKASQCLDPNHADFGAWIRPEWGLADPSGEGTAALAAGAGWLSLLIPDCEEYPERASAAFSYLSRIMEETGRLHLRSCNIDSSPDNAFALQLFCPLVQAIRTAGRENALPFFTVLKSVCRRGCSGLLDGGFHTPNHRWVIAAALAMALSVLEDSSLTVEAEKVLRSYLEEGPDYNREGFAPERSAGIYDGVCARSLLWPEHPGFTGFYEGVLANLILNQALLHPDYTIETGLSTRQDRMRRMVPHSLAPAYRLAALRFPEHQRLCNGLAAALWHRADPENLTESVWRVMTMERFGAPETPAMEVLGDLIRIFSECGLARIRRGRASLSAFARQRTLARFRLGDLSVEAVTMDHAYFGVGRFVADRLEEIPAGFRVHSVGAADEVHRPGYELPLGEPVPPESWETARLRRNWRPMPPCRADCDVRLEDDALVFRLRSDTIPEGVIGQMAIDFPEGTQISSGQDAFRPLCSGERIPAGRKVLRFKSGEDVLTLKTDRGDHLCLDLRDSAPLEPGNARVIVAFCTPADFEVRLEFG
jgi:hypothetical protein